VKVSKRQEQGMSEDAKNPRRVKAIVKRVKVLERTLSGGMTSEEAAASLGVTERQLRRLKSKYKQEGEKGLIHGNRGRKPKHSLPDELKAEVRRLRDEKYRDANFCHLADLLAERENIKLSPSSVRRILKSGGRESQLMAGGITWSARRGREVKKEGGAIDAGNANERGTGDLHGRRRSKRREAVNGALRWALGEEDADG
jgi:transposase